MLPPDDLSLRRESDASLWHILEDTRLVLADCLGDAERDDECRRLAGIVAEMRRRKISI